MTVVAQPRRQFVRYAVVGLVSNALVYVIYVVLTRLGMGPKLAMSLLYGIGVLQTFVLNRRWAFQFDGNASLALFRYVAVYAAGYVINLLVLILLVDQAGLPHIWVQGMMILLLALMIFLAQRYWVFRCVEVGA